MRLQDGNLLTAADATEDLGFFGLPNTRGGGGGRRGGGSQLGPNRITAARLLSFLTDEKVGWWPLSVARAKTDSRLITGRCWCRAPRFPKGPNALAAAADLAAAAAAAVLIPPTRRAMPPQIVVAAENYNRMIRMINAGEKLRMQVDPRS